MAHRILVLAAAVVLASVAQSAARELAPKVPTALVEDVKSGTAGVEFMDYVAAARSSGSPRTTPSFSAISSPANRKRSPAAR